jgi:hypothetical protein
MHAFWHVHKSRMFEWHYACDVKSHFVRETERVRGAGFIKKLGIFIFFQHAFHNGNSFGKSLLKG